MAGVERHGFTDNFKAGAMTESIAKEKRIQREYFKAQEAAGKIKAEPPPPKTLAKSAIEAVGIPEYVTRTMRDPVAGMTLATSKNMWTSNPGYIVRDGPRMASTTQRDFVYDQEEIEFYREQGYLSKTHNRRRDEFVMFVESWAKQKHMSKGVGAPSK